MKPKSIHLVLQEINVLIRKITIKKVDLQKRILETILHDTRSVGLNFPFPNPVISHYIKTETDDEYTIILFIADQDLINDYYDVFERLGCKNYQIDLPSLAMYQYYSNQSSYDVSNTLMVGVFEHMLSIHIFEEGIPIFSMIEELDGVGEEFFDTVENYIERIANYYRFNLRKDKKTIYNALIFNMTDRVTHATFTEKMGLRLKAFITTIVNIDEFIPLIQSESRVIHLAYTSNQLTKEDIKLKTNFKIDRLNTNQLYANYLLVFALAIFSVFTLLYIPLQLKLQEFKTLSAYNQSLVLQQQALQNEVAGNEQYSQTQIDYNEAYEFLVNQENSPSRYIKDLFVFIQNDLSVSKYSVDTINKKITIVISADSESSLTEYLLDIYEAYGIIDATNPLRWMTASPIRRNLSPLVMEVTVYYA